VKTIHEISRLLWETPAVMMFSTGKDSIVTLDLMIKHYKGEMKFVYLYFVKGLPMKESILQHYEKRYGIAIDRLPSAHHIAMKTGKKTQSDTPDKAGGLNGEPLKAVCSGTA
jgi:3'-phosphoadenosine 5'-phosphosulfate sulfotransferase (PAPS reductase)/FAD synthetase